MCHDTIICHLATSNGSDCLRCACHCRRDGQGCRSQTAQHIAAACRQTHGWPLPAPSDQQRAVRPVHSNICSCIAQCRRLAASGSCCRSGATACRCSQRRRRRRRRAQHGACAAAPGSGRCRPGWLAAGASRREAAAAGRPAVSNAGARQLSCASELCREQVGYEGGLHLSASAQT